MAQYPFVLFGEDADQPTCTPSLYGQIWWSTDIGASYLATPSGWSQLIVSMASEEGRTTVAGLLSQDSFSLAPVRTYDTPTKLTDPSTLPTGTGGASSFSPDGRFLAVSHDTSPYITIYERSGTTFTYISSPSAGDRPTGSAGSYTGDTAWSPDGRFLSVAHQTSPYITIYERQGTTFTKLANPGTLPTGLAAGAAFSPDGRFLAVAHTTSPYVSIYERSGTTFTYVSSPSAGDRPTGNGNGAAWSPDGRFLSVAHDTSPYITIYERSGTTFTKLANPSDLPTGAGHGTAWSPDGRFVSVAHTTSPYVTIYARSGTTFTKLTNPSDLPPNNGWGTAWSPDGRFLSVAHGDSPYVLVYRRTGIEFIKEPNLSPAPAGHSYGAAFSPEGRFFAVTHATSPYITIYETTPDYSGDWPLFYSGGHEV